MNFQVMVLKILVGYPDGFAVMDDLKRDMAILATSGREWADRTKRLGSRVPDLDIFLQGLVQRISGGWQITSRGRTVLEFMEAHPGTPEPMAALSVEQTIVTSPTPGPPQEAFALARSRASQRCSRRSWTAYRPL
ncbi:hypothetical protein [Bradyrhizobium elkanii]|uniref:hypothetical protein n=1 Tax=Bradyrhizobium elkanii TaxID=29448 RepID=UPI0005703448|nr:hypothetical protein [Bradyrhizobium elkanii]WLA83258.1 hypothetical protein QNJ99_02660 [Bradyrhizobium elkanii]